MEIVLLVLLIATIAFVIYVEKSYEVHVMQLTKVGSIQYKIGKLRNKLLGYSIIFGVSILIIFISISCFVSNKVKYVGTEIVELNINVNGREIEGVHKAKIAKYEEESTWYRHGTKYRYVLVSHIE